MKDAATGFLHIKKFRLSSLRKVFSLMSKLEKIIALLLLLAMTTSGFISYNNFYIAHTGLGPATGGQYSEGMLGQPRLINPLLATTLPDTSIVRLVFSGLYTYDTHGVIVPDLATDMPTISEDQKQYTIHLRKNVSWHNGRPFTADDVIFTIRELQDPNFRSPLRDEWLNTGVEKIDDATLVFKNKDVSGPFIQNLTLPILPKSVWSNSSPDTFLLSNYNLEAIGTGPYAIKEISKLPSGNILSVKLEAWTNYYKGRAKLDTIVLVFYETSDDIINALHSKEIDGFGFTPFNKDLYIDSNDTNVQIIKTLLPQYQALFFNLNKKTFADKNVRKALSLATDKDSIIQNVFNGNAKIMQGPIVAGQLGYQKQEVLPSSLADAQKILDSAGWKVNTATNIRAKNGVPLEFTIATNDSSLNAKTAELVASKWQQLNAKVHLNILPTKELSDTIIWPRNFDVLLFAQKSGADPDPFSFWHSSQSKSPGLNITGFNNAEADKIISEARATTHRDIRETKYARFSQILQEEVPAIFLNQSMYVYVVSTKIKNIGFSVLYDPSLRFLDVANWYTKEKRSWK